MMRIIVKVTFIALFLVFLISSLYLGIQKLLIGDEQEREKVLEETLWQLTNEGYFKEDIAYLYVTYNFNAGGRTPYDVVVVFNEDPNTGYIYSWEDADTKSGVIEVGETAPQRFE